MTLDTSTDAPCISRRVSLFVGIASKSRPARCGSPNQTSLTHSFLRPDKREETGGEGWEKEEEQHGFIASSGVAHVLQSSGLFSSSHHPIQSPSVTMPFSPLKMT